MRISYLVEAGKKMANRPEGKLFPQLPIILAALNQRIASISIDALVKGDYTVNALLANLWYQLSFSTALSTDEKKALYTYLNEVTNNFITDVWGDIALNWQKNQKNK